MKKWISAARLRTLPLSLSGVLLGNLLALAGGQAQMSIFVLSLFTTICYQILSNYANDYGDAQKGTDQNKIGEKRAVSSGVISASAMKNAMILFGVLSGILTLVLVYVSFGKEQMGYVLLFLFLGILSIIAAIKYTVGKNPYGYSGLGDIFVFVFFGWVSLLGSHFLHTKEISPLFFLPATAVGLLSVAVLNLNNMRDFSTDALSGKNTLVVKKGLDYAKKYHSFLVTTPLVLGLIFSVLYPSQIKLFHFLWLIVVFPLFKHLRAVWNDASPIWLDSQLKVVALSTFVFSLLLGIGYLLS
ncbi:MAG: 1,4-dihydroxy-2-naphthoate octaprenyltransferase [Flavobacteriaceae bacterium]|nr:MAG: 1,4-dihydroxy-2-naphthoate octaprenyltransferase [Flavobacteriaceae bacterium]